MNRDTYGARDVPQQSIAERAIAIIDEAMSLLKARASQSNDHNEPNHDTPIT